MRKLTLTLAAVVAFAGISLGTGTASAAGFGLQTTGGPNWLDFRGGGLIVDGDRVDLVPSHFEVRPIPDRTSIHW